MDDVGNRLRRVGQPRAGHDELVSHQQRDAPLPDGRHRRQRLPHRALAVDLIG